MTDIQMNLNGTTKWYCQMTRLTWALPVGSLVLLMFATGCNEVTTPPVVKATPPVVRKSYLANGAAADLEILFEKSHEASRQVSDPNAAAVLENINSLINDSGMAVSPKQMAQTPSTADLVTLGKSVLDNLDEASGELIEASGTASGKDLQLMDDFESNLLKVSDRVSSEISELEGQSAKPEAKLPS